MSEESGNMSFRGERQPDILFCDFISFYMNLKQREIRKENKKFKKKKERNRYFVENKMKREIEMKERKGEKKKEQKKEKQKSVEVLFKRK